MARVPVAFLGVRFSCDFAIGRIYVGLLPIVLLFFV